MKEIIMGRILKVIAKILGKMHTEDVGYLKKDIIAKDSCG